MRYYIIVILSSLIPLFAIFLTPLFPHTHDGHVHLARMAAYFKALTDGGLPVRWAGELNYGYGMPLFNFIYQLPYLLSSLFISLGFGLTTSFKIVLSLSFILSGLFIYMFALSFFKDNKKALLITLFYQFAPFRLVEILVRGSFGEMYTYTFLPLILFFLLFFYKKEKYRYFVLTSLATALLVISHNSLSLVFFIIALLFTFIFIKSRKIILLSLASLATGLMLAAFYWIPAIFEHKYTYGNLFMKDMYKDHFPPLINLFIPNIFNSSLFQTGGISVQLGAVHVVAILSSIGVFIFRKKIAEETKKILLFSISLLFMSLFLMQPVSYFLWENISLLRQFQFPWRFLAVTSFATSLLAVSFFSFRFFQKKWVYFLTLIIVVLSTFSYWTPPLGFDKIAERDYWNYPLNTTYFGETDLIWSEGPAKAYPKQRVEVISGEGVIKNFITKNKLHSYTVEAKTKVQLVDHTQYFPGWKVLVDSSYYTPVEFQDGNWRGQLVFWVPEGVHQVKVFFTENKLRFASNTLSIGAVIFLAGALLISKMKQRKNE